ncbi:cation:proton antiporter [Candidatus Nitrosotenuis cloacae]|uniref:cation:proton antiporter domain-containing protein n=1 Tax=Candidatus Nitrosotenuis cloacae TaxID=1603555 RepID=UPI00227FE19B|nr:cation:proton antiporter [Candidatus Nitrosotenuis cloacae]
MEFDFSQIQKLVLDKITATPSPSELIIQDFAVIMIIASIMALISYKLKQPMIMAFILAGMIIGPHTPPFSLITHVEILHVFAEIGIILLLFVIGMEFPIEKLKNIGKKATIIAISEASGTFLAGFTASQLLGFSLFDSLFLALAISVTSTVIIMKVLEELGMVKDEATYLIVGIAVIEDILIISLLAVLQSVGASGGLSIVEVGTSIGLVIAFIVGVIVIGSKIVPRCVDIVGRTNHSELLIIGVLGVAFGLSFIAFKLDISVATGAFFAGVLIAESKMRVATKIIATPIRDMFGALFFISVGALMDIKQLPLFIIPAVILVVVSFAAKFLTVWAASRAQKLGKTTSLRTGIGLSSSGGELALVAAKGGADVGVTSSFVLPMVGAMTVITTFISPYVIKFGWKLTDRIEAKEKTKNP